MAPEAGGGTLRVKFAILLVGTLLLTAYPLGAQGIGGIGGFGGPSILGRGGRKGQRQSDGLRIRPYVGVNAIHDSGLTSIQPGNTGIFTRGASGIEVLGGVYGTKEWKRDQVQISYSGDYRAYNAVTGFNGTDQSLALSYSRLLTKRVSLEGSVSAGTTNRAFGGISQFNNSNGISVDGLPTMALFDTRMNYGGANGTLSYNLSSRTSLTFSGGGYFVKRSNAALFGVTGIQARADVARRINKSISIGVDYSFSTFQFSRAFGDTYLHGVSAYIAKKIGRQWELNLRGGVMRVETLGQREVTIDPAIAAIIGVPTGLEVLYQVNTLGSGAFSLTRAARSGTVSFVASRTVIPGNGLILTSQMDSISVGYNRRLSRTINFDALGGFVRLRGLGLITGTFEMINVGAGVGWQVARYTQITARVDRRNSATQGAASQAFNLNGTRFSVGFIFTPSDIPVSLW